MASFPPNDLFFHSVLALIALSMNPPTHKCFCPSTQICFLFPYLVEKNKQVKLFSVSSSCCYKNCFFPQPSFCVSEDSIHCLVQTLSWYKLASHFNLVLTHWGSFPKLELLLITKPFAKQKSRRKKLSQQYTEAVMNASLHTIILYLAICSSSFPWRIPSFSHGQKNENNKLLKRSSGNKNITDGIGESTAKKKAESRKNV